ncbi:MAG TPA: hypothetical protein VM012_11240 [Flavitalea sp.]|nr:hypothetical protein [Flavitalea sp.]
MRIHQAFLPIALLITSTVFVSCSKNDDNSTAADPSSQIVMGTWKVQYYFDNADETSDFNNFTFTFNNDGTLTATNGTISAGGGWTVINDDGKKKFVLTIVSTSVLQKLNDDWQIVSSSSTELKLKDDNDTKVHELRFTKK